MYVHCFVLLHTYMCVQWLIQAEQCTYLSVHGSSGFIQSHTMNMQFLSLPKIFPGGMPFMILLVGYRRYVKKWVPYL